MKLKLVAAVAALSLSSLAHAAGDPKAEALMKKSDCFSCHAVGNKVVGPSYKDVAKKYKGNAKAPAMLADKIIKGGAGNWNAVTGGVPMTPHPQISKADATAMAKWVLAQ
ncbi:c-type cytochrome [Thermithiobacillus plumbiphilus]|uniref:C-type cytochrome n=1 Tax=Thermithiobacillus plumbiphilus TaxID=1729899 RepID=A0ABU9DBI4_9PROT